MILLPLPATTINPHRLPSVALRDRSRLPASPGVYFAIRGREILYVGKSLNLNQRWQGGRHHEYANLARRGNVRLYYKVLNGWSDRQIRALESELIALYQPPLNDVGVGKRPSSKPTHGASWWIGAAVVLGVLGVGYVVHPPFRDAVDDLIEFVD